MTYKGRSDQRDIPTGRAGTLDELRSSPDVEPVSDMNMDTIELEKFMNEPVEILVHKSQLKGSLEVITPNVNGLNQPIVRGFRTVVKRKYVEALIMGHTIEYEQQIDQHSPDKFKMVEKKSPSYPFDVTSDTQRGLDWKRRMEATL